MGEEETVAPATAAQLGGRLGAHVEGGKEFAGGIETIQAQPDALVQQGLQIIRIAAIAAVADDDAVGGQSGLQQEIQSLVAQFESGTGVAEDGQVGLAGGLTDDVEQLAVIVGDTGLFHAGLEDAGQDAGAVDALGALLQEQPLDLVVAALGDVGHKLIVEAGGGDHVDAGLLGHVADQTDVAAQVDGGAVHDGLHAVLAGFLKELNGQLFDFIVIKERVFEIHPQRPVHAGDVLMHESLAEIGGVDGT